ncbi:unnamed protein product [Cercopithifilaria johnstoni]|uniref:Uncharacterized protein n=1 Tax=Cercopithifilaria johnstoni TaxID=2874296 RepID=A0A8J2Q4I0_9BILA|nr:unnamed protein product [Cercopithifilaria johnstoni]
MQLEKRKEKTANGGVICPYSEGLPHVVPVCDVLLHLAKCRRLYYKRYGVKAELKRCKYNGCHYVLAPEVMLHELTCHSRVLYQECRRKMRYPPVPLQTVTSSSNLNEGVNSDSDSRLNLMVFD